MSEQCPKCGAARLPRSTAMNSVNWECHSYQYLDGFRRFEESSECLRRQLAQAQAELATSNKKYESVCVAAADLLGAHVGYGAGALGVSDGVTSVLAELAAERERAEKAEAIVGRLPKTADGVPVVPGMEIFGILPDGRTCVANAHAPWVGQSDWYSTKAAAEASKAAKEKP